jgi:hypothetical protein
MIMCTDIYDYDLQVMEGFNCWLWISNRINSSLTINRANVEL